MSDKDEELSGLDLGGGGEYISEKTQMIFNMFDQDKDELINMDELRGIFHQMG